MLHVIPAIASRYGGPSYAVTALAKALIQRDVHVVIATTDADGAGRLSVPIDTPTERNRIPIRYFPRQCSEAFKYSRPMARWLKENVENFDLVHIHAIFSHSSVAAYKACKEKDIPYIVRPLGTLDPSTIRRKALRKRLFQIAWGRDMLSCAAKIHYSTNREKELVESSLGTSGGIVVPIGINLCPEATLTAKANNPMPSMTGTDPYIIFLGRLDPIKNVELLIDAFSEVTSSDGLQNWRLLIVGDGNPEYVTSLRLRARLTSAGSRIQFPGWLIGSPKTEAISGAELFALTSRHENFGRAVVEAMSQGVPVLISDNVFVADDVREFEAGWVASGSLDEVVRILREAVSDDKKRQRRGVRARQLVSRKFDVNLSAENMVTCYESIVSLS